MDEFFDELKGKLVKEIPEYDSPDFKKLRDDIKKKLKSKESDMLILIRRLKILILGDWYTEEKKRKLMETKDRLLKGGLYAETIDKYYDMSKRGGLSQIQILELCCVHHQLIVFIDGEGKGTLAEQNYLCSNYIFHGKTIFFIEESKFDKMKDNPCEYFKDFPTIITYNDKELAEKIFTYSRLRIYRLAHIILNQEKRGRGLSNPSYEPWSKRIKKKRFKL